MVTAAVAGPTAVGWKCMWTKQLAPAASVDPQVLACTNSDAPVPLKVMPVIVTVALLLLITLTHCEELIASTAVVPKEAL